MSQIFRAGFNWSLERGAQLAALPCDSLLSVWFERIWGGHFSSGLWDVANQILLLFDILQLNYVAFAMSYYSHYLHRMWHFNCQSLTWVWWPLTMIIYFCPVNNWYSLVQYLTGLRIGSLRDPETITLWL